MRKLILVALFSAALLPASADATVPVSSLVEGNSTSIIPVAITANGGEVCHSGISHVRWWAIPGGAQVATITLIQNGWCAKIDGSAITRGFGWDAKFWDWGPYCLTNTNETDSWKTYPTWKHGQATASIGINTGFGCIAAKTGHSSLEISALQWPNGQLFWDSNY